MAEAASFKAPPYRLTPSSKYEIAADQGHTSKEAATLVSPLALAILLSVFQDAARAKTAFDSRVLLALHNSATPPAPLGPAWLREAARDITSLDSIIVFIIIRVALVGYLFLINRPGVGWLILVAVPGASHSTIS